MKTGKLVDGKFWCCPNCGQKLAEIVGSRAVIRFERRVWSMALTADPEQVCPKCGETMKPPKEVMLNGKAH